MLVRYYHHYHHHLHHRAERSIVSTLLLRLDPLCHRGSASFTCPVCPSYVLGGHHDCSASLSLWEVSQPQGELYMVLCLSVAYLSHAHSCCHLPLPPPKSVKCNSFIQLCYALCLFAERHTSQSIVCIFTGEFSHRIFWKCNPS